MKQKTLTHDLTPESLHVINEEIERLLEADDLDSDRLLSLSDQRDGLVTEHLASLPEDQRKAFAKLELETNKFLIARIAELGKETLVEATSQIRKRKAANKYLE